MSPTTKPDPPGRYDHLWSCSVCRVRYVVPSLARDCEARHDRETAPETDRG